MIKKAKQREICADHTAVLHAAASRCIGVVGWKRITWGEPSMDEVSTINLETAKTLGLAVPLHFQQLIDEVID
jgi:hypothetical protein